VCRLLHAALREPTGNLFSLGFCQLGEFDACLQQRIRQFRKLLFDPGDLAAQPAGEGFFHFQVRAAAIEIVDGLSFFIEWDKAARRALTPQFTQERTLSIDIRCMDGAATDRPGPDNSGSLPGCREDAKVCGKSARSLHLPRISTQT
jgi:hypothetical protein